MHRAFRQEMGVYHPFLKRQLKPSVLVVETTTKCNANCSYCGRMGTGEHMDFELFKAIVDAAPWAKEVHPLTRGEPLMYPDIIKAIRYIKSKGKRVVIYTNGSLLGMDEVIPFLKSDVDEVRFSIDDCEKETYELVRRGLDFDVVLQNVRRLVVLRNISRTKMKISVRATVTVVNVDRIDEIRKFWENIVDDFVAVPELPVLSHEDVYRDRYVECGKVHCPDPFTTLAIRYNGDVVYCCNDWHDNYQIGHVTKDVTSEELLELFNSKFYWALRGVMVKSEWCPAICAVCRNRKGPKNV